MSVTPGKSRRSSTAASNSPRCSAVAWFANLSNPSTRRAYENAIRDFVRFTGIARPEEFRTVTRAHIIAWRDELAHRGLGGNTIRHRLASLASLFDYLCERNAVTHNPVKGVERPRMGSGQGKTPALGNHQARELLAAPQADTLRRDPGRVRPRHVRQAVKLGGGGEPVGWGDFCAELGNPSPQNLAKAQRMGQATNRKAADAFAANMLPVMHQMQAEGVTSLASIAKALNDRGIGTARGGTWHISTIRNLLTRA